MSRPGRTSDSSPNQRDDQGVRVTVMALIGGIILLLLMMQQWSGALGVAASAALMRWLGSPRTDTATLAAAPPSTTEGHHLMAAKIVPAWSHQLDAVQATLQDGSAELLTSFSTMLSLCDELQTTLSSHSAEAKDLALLKGLASEMQTQCEKSLHGLQFGDRIAQMVDILNQDTRHYIERIPQMDKATPEDAQHWLDAFEARFTTEEQRHHHHGQPPPPHQDKVDFF